MAQAKVRIEGLTKRFGRTLALDGVDMHVAEGRRTVLIGPAASGKTVLMKCIGGVHLPDAGTVAIDGSKDEVLDRLRRGKAS